MQRSQTELKSDYSVREVVTQLREQRSMKIPISHGITI